MVISDLETFMRNHETMKNENENNKKSTLGNATGKSALA